MPEPGGEGGIIENSFLSDKVKRMYRRSCQERLDRFRRD